MSWNRIFLICMLAMIYMSVGCSTWNPWKKGKTSEPATISQPAVITTPQPTVSTESATPENTAMEPEFEAARTEPKPAATEKEVESPGKSGQPENQMEVIEQFMDSLITDLMDHFLDQDMLTNEDLKKDQRFIYSAFVDESDYNETTPFGRLLGDALATKIQNQGFQVVEVRLSKAIRIHKQFGVVALSQDLQQLMDEHKASFITTGSYTLTPIGVYVSAKIIGKSSQIIYASSSKWLPRSPLVDYLLNFREPTIKIEEME